MNFLLNFSFYLNQLAHSLWFTIFSLEFLFVQFALGFWYDLVSLSFQKFLFFTSFNFMQLLLTTTVQLPLLFMRSCLSMDRMCKFMVYLSWHTFLSLLHASNMHEWHSYGYNFIRLWWMVKDYFFGSSLSACLTHRQHEIGSVFNKLTILFNIRLMPCNNKYYKHSCWWC